jgi:hypothetical protein
MWCQAKAQRLSTEISCLVDSVSRSWSAFNRLGSFIRWEQTFDQEDDTFKVLANEGYIWDEDTRELKKVSYNGVNVPLNKTLNYLSRVRVQEDLRDVIMS